MIKKTVILYLNFGTAQKGPIVSY